MEKHTPEKTYPIHEAREKVSKAIQNMPNNVVVCMVAGIPLVGAWTVLYIGSLIEGYNVR